MAWISDTLAQRADQLGEEAYLPAARIAAAALALVRNRAQPPNSVLNVVRFYEGQLLAEDDLNVEVDYTGTNPKTSSLSESCVGSRLACRMERAVRPLT